MSKMDFSVNHSPLKTVVSRKAISFSDISAMNFIVGWKLLASLIKSSTSFLSQSRWEKTSILVAWCYFVGLGLFRSPPCRCLQKTLLFLCPLQPHGFGDNCFLWTQTSFQLGLGQAFSLGSVWGLEGRCCETTPMLCVLFLFPLLVDCNWLDLDKVSLKLASKNLVHSELKPRFWYFLFHFKEEDFHMDCCKWKI